MKRRNSWLLILLLCTRAGYGQELSRYLVLFRDKAGSSYQVSRPEDFLSPRAIARREKQQIGIAASDLPVNASYVGAVKQTGARVLYTTRWFNGAVVDATAAQLEAIRALPFYKGIERDIPLMTPSVSSRILAVSGKLDQAAENIDHGAMTAQMEALGIPSLHAKGIRGEGMLIAVMDAGFSRAPALGYLKAAFDENRIVETFDFVAEDTQVYDNHFHGVNVLSTIAAYQPGVMVGAAFKASFLLYRTENETSETPYEEVTWLIAAERADSLGADIINTSLGYNTFDNPAADYTYEDMDGQTTIISRAARWAARKGIVVVNAAGNSGDLPWRYITAPADVDSVLSVGSVGLNGEKAPNSSVGPAFNGVLKPDVVAVGYGAIIGNDVGSGTVSSGSGTSFAAPQVAGLCALIWQKYPELTARDVVNVVRKSGHQYANPDNFLGYGLPSAAVAEEVVQKEYIVLGSEPAAAGDLLLFPNPVKRELTIRAAAYETGRRASFTVYSTAGARLMGQEKILEQDNRLDVSHLEPGLYFLVLRVQESERIMKFIRE